MINHFGLIKQQARCLVSSHDTILTRRMNHRQGAMTYEEKFAKNATGSHKADNIMHEVQFATGHHAHPVGHVD